MMMPFPWIPKDRQTRYKHYLDDGIQFGGERAASFSVLAPGYAYKCIAQRCTAPENVIHSLCYRYLKLYFRLLYIPVTSWKARCDIL